MSEQAVPPLDRQVVHVKAEHFSRVVQSRTDMRAFDRALAMLGIEMVIDGAAGSELMREAHGQQCNDGIPIAHGAQGQEFECDGCATLGYNAQTEDAAPVREVDPKDAQEGDAVTVTGVVRAVDPSGQLRVRVGAGDDVIHVSPEWATVTRPAAPPLPSEPGAVIRCRVVGKPGYYIAERHGDDGWLVAGLVNPRGSEEIERVIDVLWPLPDGVDTGGRER